MGLCVCVCLCVGARFKFGLGGQNHRGKVAHFSRESILSIIQYKSFEDFKVKRHLYLIGFFLRAVKICHSHMNLRKDNSGNDVKRKSY